MAPAHMHYRPCQGRGARDQVKLQFVWSDAFNPKKKGIRSGHARDARRHAPSSNALPRFADCAARRLAVGAPVISFERASAYFNLGSYYSQVAKRCNLSTAEGVKTACMNFQVRPRTFASGRRGREPTCRGLASCVWGCPPECCGRVHVCERQRARVGGRHPLDRLCVERAQVARAGHAGPGAGVLLPEGRDGYRDRPPAPAASERRARTHCE